MQSTSGLRSLLLSTLGAPNHAQTTEQELYEELMTHKHVLLNLFDVGKRSPEQQRAVESGEFTHMCVFNTCLNAGTLASQATSVFEEGKWQ